ASRMANHRRLLLQADKPVLGGRSSPCKLHLRVGFQNLLQNRFLVRLEIHEKDVLAVVQGFFETAKVVVGRLDPEQSTFPRAKTEHDEGEENKGYPADGGLRPAGNIGDAQNQHGTAEPDQSAAYR